MRVGLGYDVHKLVEDRKLIIGGVESIFQIQMMLTRAYQALSF